MLAMRARAKLWWGAAVVLAVAIGVAGCDVSGPQSTRHIDISGAGAVLPRVTWGNPPEGQDPKAVVILLHAGGWQPSLEGYREQVQFGEQLQTGGYATVAIGYSAGAEGFREVEHIYQEARHRYPGVPICAMGASAGGNLSLMLATREPDLACVISVAGPTDLTTLAEQGSKQGEEYAVTAFGRDHLAEFSPVRFADEIHAKVLMVMARNDPLVPFQQALELKQALPSAELNVLPPGDVGFVHSSVDGDAILTSNKRQADFLASVANGG